MGFPPVRFPSALLGAGFALLGAGFLFLGLVSCPVLMASPDLTISLVAPFGCPP